MLGPGIRQGFGETGDREICRRCAIGDRCDDEGRKEGERSEQADVPFAHCLPFGNPGHGGNSAEPDVEGAANVCFARRFVPLAVTDVLGSYRDCAQRKPFTINTPLLVQISFLYRRLHAAPRMSDCPTAPWVTKNPLKGMASVWLHNVPLHKRLKMYPGHCQGSAGYVGF